MELILTALIKAITFYWERGSGSGDKQLETQQKPRKFQMHQLPLPPTFDVTIDLLSTVP